MMVIFPCSWLNVPVIVPILLIFCSSFDVPYLCSTFICFFFTQGFLSEAGYSAGILTHSRPYKCIARQNYNKCVADGILNIKVYKSRLIAILMPTFILLISSRHILYLCTINDSSTKGRRIFPGY